jgi:hypothetical protein
LIQILCINAASAGKRCDVAAKPGGVNRFMARGECVTGGIRQCGDRLVESEKGGIPETRALPRGNRVFERLGGLLVDELERKTFFEVSHHPRLNLAEHDQ